MNKLLSIVFGAALLSAGLSAGAADNMKQGNSMAMGMDMDMDMKMMDTNKDGMISKDEFMKYHEAMYDKMKKNKNGMVDLKDMEMMHGGMMKDGKMKGGMMKDDKMMKDSMKK